MNNQLAARKINELARIRAKMKPLQDRAEMLSLQLIKHGGGASNLWNASVIHMPAKTMRVSAHDQLRLTEA